MSDYTRPEDWEETWQKPSEWLPVINEGQPAWTPGIYQIERNDPLLGGEYGISNVQAKQLAARTQYLLTKFLAIHKADGRHAILAKHIAPNAKISESKFNFGGDSTAAFYTEVESRLSRLSILERAMSSMLSNGGTPVGSLFNALILSWQYSSSSLDFCLFTDEFNFLESAFQIPVVKTVTEDDSIDVVLDDVTINELVEGSQWVLNIPGQSRHIDVTVNSVLEKDPANNTWRVLLAGAMGLTISETDKAYLSKTSWDIDNRQAHVDIGGIYVTRAIETLKSYNGGVLAIAHETVDMSFVVYYRIEDSDVWYTAPVIGQNVLGQNGLYISTYKLPTAEKLYLKIQSNSTGVVDHMAVYASLEDRQTVFVRKPKGRPGMIISRYGALYDDQMDGLEVHIRASNEDSYHELFFSNNEINTEPIELDIESLVHAEFPLTSGTTYVWYARYVSNRGYMSDYSEPVTFTRA